MTASKLGPPAREGAPIGAALQGVGRAFSVLELVADRPLRASEIARALGLSWATAHRVLTYLTEMGYLDRDPSNATVLGRGALLLAGLLVPRTSAAPPHLSPLPRGRCDRGARHRSARQARPPALRGPGRGRGAPAPRAGDDHRLQLSPALRFQGPRSTRAREARVRGRLPEPAARGPHVVDRGGPRDPATSLRGGAGARATPSPTATCGCSRRPSRHRSSTPTAMSWPRSPSWSGPPELRSRQPQLVDVVRRTARGRVGTAQRPAGAGADRGAGLRVG